MINTSNRHTASSPEQSPIPALYLDSDLGAQRFARFLSVRPREGIYYFAAQLSLFSDRILPNVLLGSSKSGHLCPKTIAFYGLIPLISKGEYHRGVPAKDWHYRDICGKSYSVYLDAENAFALTYKGIPQLVVGAERRGISIMAIEQLQLVHPYVRDEQGKLRRPGPDGLYRFRINQLKRDLVEQWALFNYCENLLVVSAASQRSVRDIDSSLTKERAEPMYDAVFAQSGYNAQYFNRQLYFHRRLSLPDV